MTSLVTPHWRIRRCGVSSSYTRGGPFSDVKNTDLYRSWLKTYSSTLRAALMVKNRSRTWLHRRPVTRSFELAHTRCSTLSVAVLCRCPDVMSVYPQWITPFVYATASIRGSTDASACGSSIARKVATPSLSCVWHSRVSLMCAACNFRARSSCTYCRLAWAPTLRIATYARWCDLICPAKTSHEWGSIFKAPFSCNPHCKGAVLANIISHVGNRLGSTWLSS